MPTARDDDPSDYLRSIGLDDADLERLLGWALRRPLAHMKAQPVRLADRDEDDLVAHVRDWLLADLRSGAHWLGRLDRNGVPVKLAKLATLQQACDEADKAMRRRLSQGPTGVADPSVGTRMEMELADGWSVVRLLTPEALDAESRAMRHCIGQGAYDGKLVDGSTEFYSLRDPAGRAHVTLEILGPQKTLRQMQGKGNEIPTLAHRRRIRPFVADRFRYDNRSMETTRVLEDAAGKRHDLDDLPEEIEIRGDVDFSRFEGRLPKRMVVRGTLSLPPELPDGILDCELDVDQLTVAGGNLRRLARPLVVRGHLKISDVPLEALHPETKIGKAIALRNVPGLVELPRDMSLAGNESLSGGLTLENTGVRSISGTFSSFGFLTLADSPIEEIPAGTIVRSWASIINCPVRTLPSSVRFDGKVECRGPHLERVERNEFRRGIEIGPDVRQEGATPAAVRPTVSMADGLRIGCGLVLDRVSMPVGLPSDLHADTVDVRLGTYGRSGSGMRISVRAMFAPEAMEAMPSDLYCRGDLEIHGGVEEIGRDTTVVGDLQLKWSAMTSLPENLRIEGRILSFAKTISSIGTGFEIGRLHRDAFGPDVRLPEGMKVGTLGGPDRFRGILPKGLVVDGDLDLGDFDPDEIPEGLVVTGRLVLPAPRPYFG